MVWYGYRGGFHVRPLARKDECCALQMMMFAHTWQQEEKKPLDANKKNKKNKKYFTNQ